MQSNPDVLPEMRKSRNPAENKNHDFLAQAMLMGRNPAGDIDWVERYAARFRELYLKDDDFREMINAELTDESLRRIQERLNEAD